MALQNLRSGVANKRPIPTIMSEGQIALNTNEASPGLFFKDSNGDLVKVGPVHIGTSAPNSSPASTAATALVTGATYQILTVGTSDFTSVGASANTVGVVFTATGTTTGTGTVSGQQGVEKGEQWLDTTGGNYVLKIYDGTAWRSEAGEFVNVSGDTMTGALLLDNAASASAPDLSFDGDANTGVYSPGADQFGVATGGTAALTIDASQNVGIGTTSPSTAITQFGGAAKGLAVSQSQPVVALEDTSASTYAYFGLSNNDLFIDNLGTGFTRFYTNGSERMRITSSGNVGIGTTSPGNNLDIAVSANSEGINIGGSGNFFGLIQYDANRSGADQAIGDIAFKWNGTRVARIIGGTGTDTTNKDDGVLQFHTASAGSATEKMRIDSSGNVGIGTTSPQTLLHVADDSPVLRLQDTGATGDPYSQISGNNGNLFLLADDGNNGASTRIQFDVDGSERMRIDSSGNVGIGTTSPGSALEVKPSSSLSTIGIQAGTINSDSIRLQAGGTANTYLEYRGYLGHAWFVDSTERARIDSSGRLLVGTTSVNVSSTVVLEGRSGATTSEAILRLCRGQDTPADGATLGDLSFGDSNNGDAARIFAQRDGGTWTSASSRPSRLVFSTTADGASSPTERMRIGSDGSVIFNSDTTDFGTGSGRRAGFNQPSGYFMVQTYQSDLLRLNRNGNDGILVRFYQANTEEGNISVSGTTVSYNGAHLSRWSQLPGGATREEILRGTVLSNLDEMCEWGEEDNEQLNRMQVSDVEGDRNVSGVFQAWDDEDDTYTNDFYCAMTGDFVIRIAQGTTVARGDLLMSAGDGTAKPQDDDIIRSKTVAKVTSTHVSETYADGSYCVPCVLMAC